MLDSSTFVEMIEVADEDTLHQHYEEKVGNELVTHQEVCQ